MEPDSPAADASLQAGDVITVVNGQRIANPHELAMNVSQVSPGSDTHLDCLRNGQAKTGNVTVAALPVEGGATARLPPTPKDRALAWPCQTSRRTCASNWTCRKAPLER